MKITKIYSQYRRDFLADMICEHCGSVETKISGYDDSNYHQNVIPFMKCKSCGKTAPENYQPLATKYGDNECV